MKGRLIGIVIVALFIGTVIPVCSDVATTQNPLAGGWIEDIDGVTILHVSGTYYEMGYQHGVLLKDKIHENYRMCLQFFDHGGFTLDELLHNWNVMKQHIPERYIIELGGVANGSDLTLDEIGLINIAHDTFNLIECCGAIAWGSATENGKLLHLRSADGSISITDPITGHSLQENHVVIIRNPDEGYASLYPIWAGDIGSWGGINEQGIGVSETTCKPNDTTLEGMPLSFRMRMVLDSIDKAEDALTILNSNRTCGWNIFISDGNVPVGYVVEQSANISYVSTWDDPIEGTEPFWQIQQVLRRTNCYISPICAALERDYYDPSGLKGLVRFILGIDAHYIVWTHYRVLSEGLEDSWGDLTINSTMKVLCDVYLGKTDFILNMQQKLFFIYQPVHQWVACPETGEMVVTFASADKIASANPVHYFNLFNLLESEPP